MAEFFILLFLTITYDANIFILVVTCVNIHIFIYIYLYFPMHIYIYTCILIPPLDLCSNVTLSEALLWLHPSLNVTHFYPITFFFLFFSRRNIYFSKKSKLCFFFFNFHWRDNWLTACGGFCGTQWTSYGILSHSLSMPLALFVHLFIYLSWHHHQLGILCFSYTIIVTSGEEQLFCSWSSCRTEGGLRGLQPTSSWRMNRDAAYFACDYCFSCSAPQRLVYLVFGKDYDLRPVSIFFFRVIKRGGNFPKHIHSASAFQPLNSSASFLDPFAKVTAHAPSTWKGPGRDKDCEGWG